MYMYIYNIYYNIIYLIKKEKKGLQETYSTFGN